MGINVLSLCDGMSCGQIALKELCIDVDNYFASEIEPNAIKVTQENFPNTKQIGDVTKITEDFLKQLPKIDFVCFGFPCRSLSPATRGRKEYNNGLKGVSGLFYPCNDILQWIKKNNNPNVLFLVENVNTSIKKDVKEISSKLGVDPVLIDSEIFSAQSRKRYYWTNIELDTLPKSKGLVLKDILESKVDEKFFYNNNFDFFGFDKRVCGMLDIKGHDMLKRISSPFFPSPTLTSCRGGNTQKKVLDNGRPRKLTPTEYRRLQTIPDWYVTNVANSHIYNMCGDGWNIETIKFLLKNLERSLNNGVGID